MNKFAYICGIAALSLGFVACDDELPNPPGQSNPQPEIFESSGLVIAQDGFGETEALNLQYDADNGLKTVLGKITTLDKFPEGFQLYFVYEVSTTEDFAKTAEFEASAEENDIVVSPSTLNTVIYENFTRDPQEITVYSRVAAYARQGESVMRLGGADKYFGEYTYKVLPFTPERVIENSYYLLTRTVGATTWNLNTAQEFTQVEEGSPYDSPVFMVKFDVPVGGLEWAVLPGSNFVAANTAVVFGVAEADAIEGNLVAADGETALAGVISEESPYSVTVNMETLTYSVAFAYEYLYVVSNGNTDFSKARKLSTQNYLNYSGFARLQNNWYLTGQPNLDGALFKTSGDEPEVSEDGVIKGEVVMTNKDDADAADMLAADGLYYIDINLGVFKYTATRINTISLIGGFNDWTLETAVDFTPSSTSLIWNLKDIALPEGELKFCCNHAWTLDFGGEEGAVAGDGDMVFKGANIKVEEAGKYDIKLNFNNVPPTFSFTKK
ncbi:MAG: hypothetical protein K2M19_06005 [Muribaculaceae bacterium]|nr:hypothetical protein [Muribaculaceae bacterium]